MNIGVMIYSRQYRTGTMALLKQLDGIVPIDLGDGGEESIRRLAGLGAQAVLVDLPRGRLAALLQSVHGDYPALPILAVNCEEGEAELLTLFEAGLTGFVPHEAGPNELSRAIRDVLAGEFHCPPRLAAALVRRVNAAGGTIEGPSRRTTLTARETQIVRLLEHSMTNKEIATRLGIETATVRNHVYNICRKLDTHRRSEIAARLKTPALRIVPSTRKRRLKP